MTDRRRLVIVGIGNPLRRDDGVGVDIVKRMKHMFVKDDILVLESNSVLESHLQPIIDFKPSHILLIDAAFLGLEPGQLRFKSASEVQGVVVSTHTLPLRFACNYLTQVTEAKIALLLIQPDAVDFGEGLSPPVETAATRVVKALMRLLL